MSILLSHVSLFHAQGRDDAKKRKEFRFVNCNVIKNRGEINTLEREITQFCFCWTYIEGFYLKSDYSDLWLSPFDIDKHFLFSGEATPFSCDGITLWGKRCSLMGQRVQPQQTKDGLFLQKRLFGVSRLYNCIKQTVCCMRTDGLILKNRGFEFPKATFRLNLLLFIIRNIEDIVIENLYLLLF